MNSDAIFVQLRIIAQCWQQMSGIKSLAYSVADPGFPEGAPTPWGRQHTILPKFPENCMKSKEFGCASCPPPPPDSPMILHLWGFRN